MSAVKTWAALLACVTVLSMTAISAATTTGNATLGGKRVLLLYSYHPEFPTSASSRAGALSVLAAEGVQLDVEFMDSKRVPDEALRENFRRLLAYKLERLPPYDLVMVSDDNAFDFAREHHESLFPGLPVVFLAVNNIATALSMDGNPLVTGVVEQTSMDETLALARRLDPTLEEIVAIVDDTSSGRADLRVLLSLSELMEGVKLRVLNIGELSWEEVGAELSRLGPNRAVLRLAAFRDRDGRVLGSAEGLALMVGRSPVPVYSLREHDLGTGILGGVLVNFVEQGRQAALLARTILQGTPASEMAVVRRSPNRAMFDFAVLERFGVPESRLPAMSIVTNRPQSFVRDNAGLVTATLSVVGLLLAMVIYLSWQIAARHRVERRLRESETRFRTIVEGTVYGMLIHTSRTPVFANQAFADLLGYDSPQDILALESTEQLYASHEHERMRAYQVLRRSGGDAPSEYDVEAVRRDGTRIVVHNVVHTTSWEGHFATQQNVVDVTVRHRAEELLRESEERFRTLVENAPEAIVVLDVGTGRLVEVNENACALFRASREHLLSTMLDDLSPPRQPAGGDSTVLARDHVERALKGARQTFEWTHRDRDGNDVATEVRLVRMPATGRVLVRGSITDISNWKSAQRELTEKSAQLEATLENTLQGICMVDAELRVVAFNQRYLDLLEYPPELFQRGDSLEKFFRYNTERGEYGDGDSEPQLQMGKARAGCFEPYRYVRTRSNGTVLEVQGQPVPDGGMVRTYTDITETHRLSQQLSHQARHDALTGLPNRREFEERLGRVLETARLQGTDAAMCYLDLDQFKVINDTCGHMAGDELLRQLSQTLRTTVRKRDTLARLGGDEFGVLLEHCSIVEATRVAEQMRTTIEEFRFCWEEKNFRVGVSIGLVPVNIDSGDITDVLSRADAACYAAKDQGRNRIHVYDEADSDLAKRHGEMQWVMHIQQALDEGRFSLDCQAIVPIRPDGVEGRHYEVLLRMNDDQGRAVPPGVFLPAAERYNLIGRIDRWVVAAALDYLSSPECGKGDMAFCSINLSGQSLVDEELLDFITGKLTESGVLPSRICFEITETAAIANLARATRFIVALKQLGCRFALDDFGSGLSSFAYLKTLPVDYLKIDGLFVKDIVHDPIDREMVRSINEIGHLMGKRTIAEFVEDDATLAMLREIGVDYAQGYGVGRPSPLALLSVDRVVTLPAQAASA